MNLMTVVNNDEPDYELGNWLTMTGKRRWDDDEDYGDNRA
jgi:hypothetical protein